MRPCPIQIDDEEAESVTQNGNHENLDTNMFTPGRKDEKEIMVKKERKGTFLITTGGILIFISLLIRHTTHPHVEWSNLAYPIIIGLHIFFLGVFQLLNSRERVRFEVIINDKQMTSCIPLRSIILFSINLTFSIAGIICMYAIVKFDRLNWPKWNILCLAISLLIAIVSNINLSKALQEPKSLRRKTLHHAIIALSMLLAANIFSVQLIDIAISQKDDEKGAMIDGNCTYARTWLHFLSSGLDGHSRNLVLIMAPVTILLCMPLVFWTQRPSSVNLIKAFIFSGAMAGYHSYQAIATSSWMLIIGPSVSPLNFNLRLGITLASPILASLLLSLAFSYLNAILQKEECKDEPTSCCSKISSVLATLLAVLPISVTIAALTYATRDLTVLIQGHWTPLSEPPYPSYPDCSNLSFSFFEHNLLNFSWSQSGLSVILLTLGFLLVLSGNKISHHILLFFGLISFASAISTLIFYFTGVFDYANEMPTLFEFYISTGCQVALGLILGFVFSFEGGSFFVAISTKKEEPKQKVDGFKI